jgi:ABC-2 type transport system permease protein
MFYALFGLALNGDRTMQAAHSISVATYMVATYGVFGVVAAALSALGIGVAMERGQGWLLVKRASPMPPAAYFTAKVMMSMLFGGLIAVALFALAATAGHVRLPLGTWAALGGTLVLGAAPFCALGCAIGAFAGPNSAPAAVNLLHLPMSFASGLWVPFEYLPPAVRTIAPMLPPYHFARLALRAIGADASPVMPHILALVAFSLVCLVIAVAAFRRDDGKTYG